MTPFNLNFAQILIVNSAQPVSGSSNPFFTIPIYILVYHTGSGSVQSRQDSDYIHHPADSQTAFTRNPSRLCHSLRNKYQLAGRRIKPYTLV